MCHALFLPNQQPVLHIHPSTCNPPTPSLLDRDILTGETDRGRGKPQYRVGYMKPEYKQEAIFGSFPSSLNKYAKTFHKPKAKRKKARNGRPGDFYSHRSLGSIFKSCQQCAQDVKVLSEI